MAEADQRSGHGQPQAPVADAEQHGRVVDLDRAREHVEVRVVVGVQGRDRVGERVDGDRRSRQSRSRRSRWCPMHSPPANSTAIGAMFQPRVSTMRHANTA
ncbi:MAG TPA: hypothetical protein VK034_27455 [Enhygromyxa sp.]|nr:hypothetical protein [Enhygromyxa sp.]